MSLDILKKIVKKYKIMQIDLHGFSQFVLRLFENIFKE
jgi:hypothetical protein